MKRGMSFVLYDAPRSNNCRKVRLLAAELGIPLELQRLDFTKGEQRSPEYLAKNPNGKIPTLDHEGFRLWESGAILRYLAALHPGHTLVPADAAGRALLDQWMFWWTTHIEDTLLTLIWERRVKAFFNQGDPDPSILGMCERQLKRFLPVLERQLEGKDHIIGDLSLADFFIAPSYEVAPALGVDTAPYVNLAAWLTRLQARPYWATT